MKLFEIVNTLQQIASAQPSINSVYEGSVYKLNELKNIKYGACVITQAPHRQDRDFIYYDFIIYYVDRLTADASNKLPVQSTGIDTLANIVLAMDELGFDFTNINYTTFTQKFEAECAGAFAEVIFAAPTELCADWYDIIVSNIQAEGNGYSILDKYATKEWVREYVTGGTGSGITEEQAQEMIDEAVDAETARTEDTYLKIGALDGYATEQWVEDKHYLTSADTQEFLTSADTQDFVTTADTQNFVTTADTADFVTTADTADFVTTAYTNDKIAEAIEQETARTENTYLKEQSLSGYATEEWVQEQGYITGCTGINDAGNNYTPVYVSGGTVIPADLSIPGNRWGVSMYVNPEDGGVDGGSFLDFHNADTISDYSGRIQKRPTTEGFSFMYNVTGATENTLAVNEHYAVDSRNVIHIQEISQSDYDELVDNDEVNPFTLYLIPEE